MPDEAIPKAIPVVDTAPGKRYAGVACHGCGKRLALFEAPSAIARLIIREPLLVHCPHCGTQRFYKAGDEVEFNG